MPAKRIPDLPTLTGAGSVAGDQLLIFDADLNVTKRITRNELAQGLQQDLPSLPELGSMAGQDADAVEITGGTITGVSLALDAPLPIEQGGTGADTAEAARTALGAAKSGENADITSLTGLTTPLTVAQGGTGAATAAAARTALGAAKSGSNADITALTALTTAISIAQGGTGATTAAGARAALGIVGVDDDASLAQNGYIKFGNGLMIQWGKSTSNNYSRAVTFPQPFSAPPFAVVVATERASGGASSGSNFVSSLSASGATMFFDETSSGSGTHTGYWVAIGPYTP